MYSTNKATKTIPQRKLAFGVKLKSLLDEYNKCLVIRITNIGSKQMSEMRKEFRGIAIFLCGKNTLIRKIIREYVKETKNQNLLKLRDLIKGNVGLVFTKQNVFKLRKDLICIKKQCSAKEGVIAPDDVFIYPGHTNIEPTQTQIFQNMDISTRINNLQIDVIQKKQIIFRGEKVCANSAYLLAKLNIKPFSYGIQVKSIYKNGECIVDLSGIDMNINEIAESFYCGLQKITSFCIKLNYPTIINIPYSLLNSYKQILGLSLKLDSYSWNGLDAIQRHSQVKHK